MKELSVANIAIGRSSGRSEETDLTLGHRGKKGKKLLGNTYTCHHLVLNLCMNLIGQK